jgi:histidinol-phosphate aminotransferase
LRQTKVILWNLTDEFEYKLDNLDDITPGSVIVICSPNNPTGTVISEVVLTDLLTRNKESLVIIDEAYCDFNTVDFTAYISKFENLLLIRSFSKAFSSAGIRLGYAIAQPELINQLKKIKNPFIINPFTAITAAHILTDSDCMKLIKDNIETVVHERERVYRTLSDKTFNSLLKTFRSYGNFNYIKFHNEKDFQFLCNQLIIYKIGVQIFEKQNAVRITIGSKSQNDLIVDVFKTILLVR